MRTCSHCGREHSDGVVECVIDRQLLEEKVPPLLPPAALSISENVERYCPSDRQLRIFEIILVCTIAFGGSLFVSILSLFSGPLESFHNTRQWAYGIIGEVASLGLLWYVLLRRSKSLSDIGFRWKWTDIGWSLVLCIGGYFAYCAMYLVAYYGGLVAVGSHAANKAVGDYFFSAGISAVTVIFLCINPFFEELVVRAYLMTEVRQLTNSALIAISVSTVLQVGYHLYQGVPLALAAGGNFLFWSIYYAKTNRIMPVILAHLYLDLGSTLAYVFRH